MWQLIALSMNAFHLSVRKPRRHEHTTRHLTGVSGVHSDQELVYALPSSHTLTVLHQVILATCSQQNTVSPFIIP